MAASTCGCGSGRIQRVDAGGARRCQQTLVVSEHDGAGLTERALPAASAARQSANASPHR